MSDQPDGLPPSPLTVLERMAAEQNEMVTAWVKAGFTRTEAIDMLKHQQLLATMLAAARQPQDGADD